jgi:hypothetical protein
MTPTLTSAGVLKETTSVLHVTEGQTTVEFPRILTYNAGPCDDNFGTENNFEIDVQLGTLA